MSEGMQEGRNAVLIDDKDNVVIAIYPLKAGDEVRYPAHEGGLATFVATEDIPLFHKIARVDIAAGQNVVKYGEFIGVATSDIKRGQHVHTQNCESSDDLEGAAVADVASASEQKTVSTKCTRTFMGYRRSDGQVGIRNHVLILPTSICASDTTERIARSVEGCVTFHNQNGCSQVNIDQQMTVDTLAGLAANPNIHSVLAVSLGCEGCQNDLVVDAIAKRTNKEVRTLIIQEVGGSIRAVEEGTRIARELVREASLCEREECGVDELIFGTNCGGSDTSSGLGSNPLIGEVSDWMVAQGATTVLCETPELFGGEHILARRAATPEVGEQVLKIVRDYEKYVQMFGAQMREGNPSPGNMAGGLTTLEEKSLGCIHKAGHSTINAVYPYAARIASHQGLVVMDTPGNDPSSVGGIIAGGCQGRQHRFRCPGYYLRPAVDGRAPRRAHRSDYPRLQRRAHLRGGAWLHRDGVAAPLQLHVAAAICFSWRPAHPMPCRGASSRASVPAIRRRPRILVLPRRGPRFAGPSPEGPHP